jgi:hypothetical protein
MFTGRGRKEEMQEERKTLFEGRVSSGRNTFFIDARQALNGHYYVSITDSRRQDDGTFQQQKVIVFEESAKVFAETVAEACGMIAELFGSRREEEIAEIRKTHPRAFMKWSFSGRASTWKTSPPSSAEARAPFWPGSSE